MGKVKVNQSIDIDIAHNVQMFMNPFRFTLNMELIRGFYLINQLIKYVQCHQIYLTNLHYLTVST